MKRIHGFSVEGAKRKKRTFSFIKKLLRSMIKCVSKSYYIRTVRSSPPEVFIQTVVLKICSKFTGAHPYRSVISVKLQSNFIEIIPRHGLFIKPGIQEWGTACRERGECSLGFRGMHSFWHSGECLRRFREMLLTIPRNAREDSEECY